MTMYEQLMQLPVFQGISVDQLTRILEVTPFDFRQYNAGQVICQGGDLCQGATFLLSGRLRLETPIFDHRVKIIQTFEGPYSFSLHRLFGADLTLRSTMVADTDRTGIMMLRKADFLRILQQYDIALINVMNLLCTRAQKQHRAIEFSAQTDPLLKLSSWILAFTEHSAKEVCIEADEMVWCDMLKLDKPAFWRCVAYLEGMHILESVSGRLKLLDRYGLRTLVGNKTARN